jgi:predicted lipoprotein
MNGRALKSSFANVVPASLAGKTVTFFGAFTFDPHSKSLILITPVKIVL